MMLIYGVFASCQRRCRIGLTWDLSSPSLVSPLSSLLSWHGVPVENSKCLRFFAACTTSCSISPCTFVISPTCVSSGCCVFVTHNASGKISEVYAFTLSPMSFFNVYDTAPMPSHGLNSTTSWSSAVSCSMVCRLPGLLVSICGCATPVLLGAVVWISSPPLMSLWSGSCCTCSVVSVFMGACTS